MVGRTERRERRTAPVAARFDAADVPAALDLLDLLELAWHDCYDEITPPDDVIDDVLVASDGRLDLLIQAAVLAATDPRDLRIAADRRRER